MTRHTFDPVSGSPFRATASPKGKFISRIAEKWSDVLNMPKRKAAGGSGARPTPTKGAGTGELSSDSSDTGVDEFDRDIGGGFPKGSVVLLAGPSGSGKTIFSFQWLFHGARKGESALYITLTEPLFKSMKDLEAMDFYDRDAVESERIKVIDMRGIYSSGGFDSDKVLRFIEDQVEENGAKRLCIDSITGLAYSLNDKARIRKFIFELGKLLASLGCTSILTSEVTEPGTFSAYGVEEFISDGIISLDQVAVGKQRQRRLQIIKMRGRGYSEDEFRFKITEKGIMMLPQLVAAPVYPAFTERVSTGNAMLDEMLSGGIYRGSTTLISGTTGTGKTIFGMQFMMDGLRRGEKCSYVGFDESKVQMMRNARSVGFDFDGYYKKGMLRCMCGRTGERSLEEHLASIRQEVEKGDVNRLVFDSLSSLAASYPEERFVAFVKSLNDYLKLKGTTAYFLTTAPPQGEEEPGYSASVEVIVDNILALRQVEMEGRLGFVLNVVKSKGSAHSRQLRRYSIGGGGVEVGQMLSGYEGVLTGTTRKVSETTEERIAEEFTRFIGPMGAKAFEEMSRRGISAETFSAYIDSLVADGIMKEDEAGEFRQRVMALLGKAPAPEQGAGGELPKRKRKGLLGSLFE